MIGIVIANNTILMYVFWELTSISSFLLISYWYNNGESQLGAIQSFMITVFGGLALLTGFIILYIITGTNTITDILNQRNAISRHPLFIPMILMLLLGALPNLHNFRFIFGYKGHGSTYTSKCLSSFGNNGKGWNLFTI